jgi:hypothetical protein
MRLRWIETNLYTRLNLLIDPIHFYRITTVTIFFSGGMQR